MNRHAIWFIVVIGIGILQKLSLSTVHIIIFIIVIPQKKVKNQLSLIVNLLFENKIQPIIITLKLELYTNSLTKQVDRQVFEYLPICIQYTYSYTLVVLSPILMFGFFVWLSFPFFFFFLNDGLTLEKKFVKCDLNVCTYLFCWLIKGLTLYPVFLSLLPEFHSISLPLSLSLSPTFTLPLSFLLYLSLPHNLSPPLYLFISVSLMLLPPPPIQRKMTKLGENMKSECKEIPRRDRKKL